MTVRSIVGILALIFCARSLSAQSSPNDTTYTWIVLELGAEIPFATTRNTDVRYEGAPVRGDVLSRPVLTAGVMKPYRVDRAVGLTGSLGGTREAVFTRIEVRHRVEFNRWTAMHLSAGGEAMEFETAGESGKRARGFSAAAGFELPALAVDLRADLLRRGSRTVSGLILGVRFGTGPIRG